jgi:para-nitrobenzyl esterase
MRRGVTVETTLGALQGVQHRGACSFLGVPYGAATDGQRRFRAPIPAHAWVGVRDARQFGPAAPQNDTRPGDEGAWSDVLSLMYPRTGSPTEGGPMSEDCLVLNVWSPSVNDGFARPVMVWIHGGGFSHGSGSEGMFEGDQLAVVGDVVTVTVNHRLGVFGYLPIDRVQPDLYSQSGVAGMLDLVLALEWVRDNIAAFGGDPGNVTIFGQSGGAAKVSHLLAMPAARGLFHKAICQSGAGGLLPSAQASDELMQRVLHAAGLSVGTAGKLAEFTVRELLLLQETVAADGVPPYSPDGRPAAGGPMTFGPTADVTHLPSPSLHTQQPGVHVPMLVGYNSHDASLLLCGDPSYPNYTETNLKSRLAQTHGVAAEETYRHYLESYPTEPARLRLARIATDVSFRSAALAFAERNAQQSSNLYVYEFAYQTPILNNLLGCTHSLDLPFVFRNVWRSPFTGEMADRHAVSTQMATAWARFAHTGDPNHDGIPFWDAFAQGSPLTMRINTEWELFQNEGSPFAADPMFAM